MKCYSLVPCFGTSFIGTSNSCTEVWHVPCFELARTTLQYGADHRHIKSRRRVERCCLLALMRIGAAILGRSPVPLSVICSAGAIRCQRI